MPLAGLWSGDNVELGILPLWALCVVVNSLLLFTVPGQLFEPGSAVTTGFVHALTFLSFLQRNGGPPPPFPAPGDEEAHERHGAGGRELGDALCPPALGWPQSRRDPLSGPARGD